MTGLVISDQSENWLKISCPTNNLKHNTFRERCKKTLIVYDDKYRLYFKCYVCIPRYIVRLYIITRVQTLEIINPK